MDRRLNRLEHIVQNRSELIRREQNKRMDWTLFALAGTTIVSLALTFIQTAYAQLDDGRRPKGQLMEWLIATNSSRVVAISFALTTLLIVGVTVFSGRIPSGKRKKQNVSSRRPHGCCGEKSTIR